MKFLAPLPPEFMILILDHTPELRTLLNTAAALPQTLEREIDRMASKLIPQVLKRSMPSELLQLACAVHRLHQMTSCSIKELNFRRVDDDLFGLEPDWSCSKLSTIIDMVILHETIEFYIQDFVSRRRQPPVKWRAFAKTAGPPTKIELYRIRRALWRFEFCSMLANKWVPSELRLPRQADIEQ